MLRTCHSLLISSFVHNLIKQLDITAYAICEAVFDLQQRAYELEQSLLGKGYIPYLENSLSELALCEEEFYGYFHEELLVGVVSCQILEGTLEVCRLFVSPDLFRTGTATELFHHVIWRHKFHVQKIKAQTLSLNEPAARFYARQGMEIVDRLPFKKYALLTFEMRMWR